MCVCVCVSVPECACVLSVLPGMVDNCICIVICMWEQDNKMCTIMCTITWICVWEQVNKCGVL